MRNVCSMIFQSRTREIFSIYIRSYFIRSTISSMLLKIAKLDHPLQEVRPGLTFKR